MMYEILYTSRFKKDYRVALKRWNNIASSILWQITISYLLIFMTEKNHK